MKSSPLGNNDPSSSSFTKLLVSDETNHETKEDRDIDVTLDVPRDDSFIGVEHEKLNMTDDSHHSMTKHKSGIVVQEEEDKDEKEWILNSKSSILLDEIYSCLLKSHMQQQPTSFLSEVERDDVIQRLHQTMMIPLVDDDHHHHDTKNTSTTVGTSGLNTKKKKILHIVEIGCGTSSLSRTFLQYLILRRHHLQQQFAFCITATDVSKVCIERNQRRDDEFLKSISSGDGRASGFFLRYEVLDVLNLNGTVSQLPPLPPFLLCPTMPSSSEILSNNNTAKNNIKTITTVAACTSNNNDYDQKDEDNTNNINLVNMVLDKGCLDTFLFRCKTHDKSISKHSPLLTQLLNNVYKMLKVGGLYVIITPRRRITSVRDFVGFGGCVRRVRIDPDNDAGGKGGRGDLVGQDGNNDRKERSSDCLSPSATKSQSGRDNTKNNPKRYVYMHVCTKHPGYIPDKDEPYRDMYDITLEDDSCICNNCGITFLKFRNGEKMEEGRGVPFWTRRWKGHKVHCHGGNDG